VPSYMGSVGYGLRFYHIKLSESETRRWLNISNCGVVVIRKGDISLQEKEKEQSYISCKEWPWHIRVLRPSRFLVRPHRKVSDIESLTSFNLRKEGVQVEVLEWRVFAQMASGFGLMTEVDCSSLFKSFYEQVRIKIAYRNPSKIHNERLFGMDKKLYLVSINVEDGVKH
jgi:hypothetical protein